MIKRDYFTIDKYSFGDFFSEGPWVFKEQTYHFHEHIFEIDEEDINAEEEHYVITKRQSDGRLFMFRWSYHNLKDKYEFGSFLTEVYQIGNYYE